MQIAEYDEVRAKISEIENAANFIPDVSTDEGYKKSKRVALDIGKVLTRLESIRKEQKSYFLEGGKAVDTQAKEIAAQLEGFQLPHKQAYKELDNLKKEREARRKAELEERVEQMRILPELMAESDSDSIKVALEHLIEEECLDFYEYTEKALKARNESRKALSALFDKKLKAEKEAAELEALRKEKEEREKKEREERIAKEAAEKARKEAEEKAAREQQEAARREAEAKAAAEAAEKARIEAEEKAKRDAIEAEKRQKEAVRQAEEKAKREALELKQKAEAEAKAREADKKHKESVHNGILKILLEIGITEAQGEEVITAIRMGKVPNVQINY